ncbi:MAG: NACHT domain-containing protein, partial [bacterium]|nr:NACHT domain-containing protein [bacterium]
DYYNVDGGYIVLGIEDDQGTAKLPPAGLERRRIENIQKQIIGQCRGHIKPECELILSPEVVDGRHLLVIWVPRSRNRPHSLQTSDDNRPEFFFREGPESRKAKDQILNNLRLLSTHVSFDEDRAAGYTTQDLRGSILRDFLQDAKGIEVDEIDNDLEGYRRLRATIKINGEEVPKNAALLFFSNEPKKVSPGACIRCGYFPDGLGGDVIEEQEFAGPLHQQVKDCVRYLKKWMTQQLRKHADKPETTTWWTYPEAAIKEAVANAVHHRDYRTACQPTLIRILPDLVQITSYPGPVPGTTPEHFRPQHDKALPPARNPLVGDLLRRCGLAEQWGSGVRRIFRAMAENGSPEPRFEFDDTKFTVELPMRKESEHPDSVGEARAQEERVEARDDFLSRVQRICRLREPEGAVIERISHRPFDYLRVTVREGEIARTYPLAVSPGGVDEKTFQDFLDVHRRYRQEDPAVLSILVYGGAPAPSELVRRAGAERVQLRSFPEYQGMIDFRHYLAEQTQRLSSDRRYAPWLYVPQRMRFPARDGEEREGDALELLHAWLADPWGRFALVLGDFGTGKTFLLHELARRMGEEGGAVTPILIEMRDLEKGRSLDELIAQHLARAGMERIDLQAFRYMLEQGRIALLFDGFDELLVRVSYDRVGEHLSTLLQAARGEAKVVVTSRTQHFLSDQQVKTALGERIELLTGHRIGCLQPFDEQQIHRFLVNRFGDEPQAQAHFKVIVEVNGLLALAHNPRLLSFIADLSHDSLEAARERRGNLSAADVYELLLQDWLGHEYERLQPVGAQHVLTVEDRWQAVTRLAVRMWERGERAVGVDELNRELVGVLHSAAAGQLSEGDVAHQVGSGTLLVRDAEGAFSFLDPSVPEWLVARRAAAELADSGTSDILGAREISPRMADFLCDLAGQEHVRDWARKVLHSAAGSGKVAQRNAQLLLDQLGEPVKERFAGQDLRGQDLCERDLSGFDLRHADLSSARLVGARLTDARLERAKLVAADLSGADLRGVDLRQADLSRARLLGADLRGARLDGSDLSRAKLVGVKIDHGTFAHARLFGAALPQPESVQPWSIVTSPCHAVAWRCDGTLLATGHDDGSVRLWEFGGQVEINRFLGHCSAVRSVAWSPDGQTLASGADDHTLRIWDLERGENLHTLEGHQKAVWSVAYAPDGKTLASGSADHTLRIWDAASGASLRTLEGHGAAIWSVAYAPGGQILASGGDDHNVRLWDLKRGQNADILEGHMEGVLSVAWSPDGQILASGSADQTVRLWGVASAPAEPLVPWGVGAGATLRTLEGQQSPVLSVAWSPDGGTLAAAEDTTVRLWDPVGGALLRKFENHHRGFRSVAWSPDGHTLAAGGDRTIQLRDPSRGTVTGHLGGRQDAVLSAAWSPDGQALAAATPTTVRLWNVASGVNQRTLEGRLNEFRCVAWSPDGRTLAAAEDHIVRLWNPGTGENLRNLRGRPGVVRSLAWSPDSHTLAAAQDLDVCLWDPASGEDLRALKGHRAAIRSVAWSPDGRTLASAGEDRTVRLWDPASGKKSHILEGHQAAVRSVAWNPDGRTLASAGEDHTVYLWDSASGENTHTFEGAQGAIRSVAWSPDGRQLAAADDQIVRLWDPDRGQRHRTLAEHEGRVWNVAWSADGQILASASQDGTVRLWDPDRGRCRAVLVQLGEGWVAYTPDGRYKLGGEVAGWFWYTIGLCRFEPGELDPYRSPPSRVADGEPLWIREP